MVEREGNVLIYNLILSFLSEMIIILCVRYGTWNHPERIMIGIVMLLISGLGTTNGIRDIIAEGFHLRVLKYYEFVGAAGIAFGTALAMFLLDGVMAEGFIINHDVPIQLISCTIACTGFAFWFKIRGRQVMYSGIGAFFTWAIYLIVYEIRPSNFLATMLAAVFVATLRICDVKN